MPLFRGICFVIMMINIFIFEDGLSGKNILNSKYEIDSFGGNLNYFILEFLSAAHACYFYFVCKLRDYKTTPLTLSSSEIALEEICRLYSCF